MRHKTILYNNANINYQDEGFGDKTIVLLHGYMNSLEVWSSYVLSRYMKCIRVITIDLLGHGESESVADIHTMDMQAEMIKSVLDHIGVRDCVMVGHSMGGYVALAFAKNYPKYIKGLCLLHSHALADSKEGKENRRRTCDIVKSNRASFIVNFIPNLFAPCNVGKLSSEIKDIQDSAINMTEQGIIAAQLGMIERESRLDLLIDADFPILFVAGKQDTRIDVENLFAQAMLPKHSEVLLLENVGHMGHIEAKPLIIERLLSFAQTCYL